MKLRIISKEDYNSFVKNSNMQSFYQSQEWMNFKEKENKKCELLGLFVSDKLVGVSLIIYTPILKKFYMAYASRGFIYDYQNIPAFKNAIIDYFKNKKVIFFRMDPPIILASYDKDLNKTLNKDNLKLIDDLKNNGFKHFGFNTAYETTQFRFIHRVKCENDFNEQLKSFSKSTRKNMENAIFRGVKIKEVNKEELNEVLHFFELTMDRKQFKGLSKSFYERLINNFKDKVKLFITYIDKNQYVANLNKKIDELNSEYNDLKNKMKHDHIGKKLKSQEEIINNQINKYKEELEDTHSLDDNTNIASLVTIESYNEIVAFASGMDNSYRKFNPKYVFYPELFKMAIDFKKEYVNFLGVKNITDKNDPDYGIYEIKKGFGGETIEYIGEFDLPINKLLYKIYKILNK